MLNKKDEAKAQLAELTQVYGRMDDYIKKFKEIAPKMKINDEGLLVYFQKGLLKSIRKKLWDAQPGPETLEEWKEAVVKAKGQVKGDGWQTRVEEKDDHPSCGGYRNSAPPLWRSLARCCSHG